MIHYFKGDPVHGIDLIGVLEDKIVERKRNQLSNYIGRSWKSLSKDEYIYWWKELGFDKRKKGAYEGWHSDYIYYENNLDIHRVKAYSAKGILVRIFGRNVK